MSGPETTPEGDRYFVMALKYLATSGWRFVRGPIAQLVRAALFVFVLGVTPGAAAEPGASDVRFGDLRIQNARVTKVPASARNAPLFMTIVNNGAVAERLIRVRTKRAAGARMMNMRIEGALMRMVSQTEILIAPNTAVRLNPIGQHVMLMGLNGRVELGETFLVALEFANSGKVEVAVSVGASGFAY